MTSEQWISVVDWRKYQHYQKGEHPPWVKVYTHLLHDDAYLELNAGARSVLHGIWLEYASSHCRLRLDTVRLTRRLNLRVTKRHMDSLVQAGFLAIVSRASLADGYSSSTEDLALAQRAEDTEVDRDTEEPSIYPSGSETTDGVSDAPPGSDEESNKEHEGEREFVRFSDDNGMSPVTDLLADELATRWSTEP